MPPITIAGLSTRPKKTTIKPIGARNGHGLGPGMWTPGGGWSSTWAAGVTGEAATAPAGIAGRAGDGSVPIAAARACAGSAAACVASGSGTSGPPSSGTPSARRHSRIASRNQPPTPMAVTARPAARNSGLAGAVTFPSGPVGRRTSAKKKSVSPIGTTNGHREGPGRWTPGGGAPAGSGRGTRERLTSAARHQR